MTQIENDNIQFKIGKFYNLNGKFFSFIKLLINSWNLPYIKFLTILFTKLVFYKTVKTLIENNKIRNEIGKFYNLNGKFCIFIIILVYPSHKNRLIFVFTQIKKYS